jgi:hypothetical protein
MKCDLFILIKLPKNAPSIVFQRLLHYNSSMEPVREAKLN